MPSVSNVRCKFHGTPIPLRRGQGRPAKGADGSRLLGECPDCEAEIDAIGVSAGELSKIDVDEAHHGHDSLMSPLSFGDLLDTIYRERGYDEYVERQVSYLAMRGREMREPWTYASAPYLPNTSPRAAAYAARKKQLAQHDFDTKWRTADSPLLCPAQRHQWIGANRIIRRGINGKTILRCRLCRNECDLASQKRHPLAHRAHNTVRAAIKAGTLVRQPCEVCGATTPVIHAHHDNYAKPLDVRWLCLIHHIRQHHNLFTRIKRAKASVARKAKWLQRAVTP